MIGLTKVSILTKGFQVVSRDTKLLKLSVNLQKLSVSSQTSRQITLKETDIPSGLLFHKVNRRLINTSSNGVVARKPISYGIVDIFKILVTVTAGLTVGAAISKRTVALLQEYELFVLEDDEDDDDD